MFIKIDFKPTFKSSPLTIKFYDLTYLNNCLFITVKRFNGFDFFEYPLEEIISFHIY